MHLCLTDFRCEFLTDPLGLDEPSPRFSWKLADSRTGAWQTAYRIRVFMQTQAGAVQWDSGRVESDQSHLVPYAGLPLQAHTRYCWAVDVWDKDGVAAAEPATLPWFETGFLSSDESAWRNIGARWIRHWREVTRGEELQPCPYFRKTFHLPAEPVSARLCITARGLYEAWINGQRVGRDVLAPGWTDYDHRIEYLTYDVTAQVRAGDNAIGVALGDGWYAGNIGGTAFENHRNHWGTQPELLTALRIVCADGSVQWVCSDEHWQAASGPLLYSDIYHGESYDARLEQQGWCEPGEPIRWQGAVLSAKTPVAISAKIVPPVRAIEELAAGAVTQPQAGCHVFDFGQNLTGVVRMRLVNQQPGARIVLRYAEMLQEDGNVYVANLRSARVTDTYICRGGDSEVYEPRFTFHGFRYAEVCGVEGEVSPALLEAIVWHSDLPQTGDFRCSNALVNQLQSNIRWGQRGNFLDVPTDCPQRDERLGWTGDAQIFAPTAAFNYDVSTFFRKWCRDMADAQLPNGIFTDVVPDVFRFMFPDYNPQGHAAWADAGVICPWVMYRHFGDLRVLEENYLPMSRWVDYQLATSENLLRPGIGYGDWLAPDAVEPHWAATPSDLIGTAYFAHTAELMHRIALRLGKAADAQRFADLRAQIVAAFNRAYVTADGRMVGDSQTAYLLVLAFDLVPQALRPRCVAHLERCFARRNQHLSTGFVGTPLICPVLTAVGRTDLAYDLLFKDDYPSWLLQVKNGATTMWERWNSWTPEGGFGKVEMNSFNHYAYGAVGQWLYATVAGIRMDEDDAPGYKSFCLDPRMDERLSFAQATLESPYGRIHSGWERVGEELVWHVEIPANTSARVYPPSGGAATLAGVRIDGALWSLHPGATALEAECGFRLVAGCYRIIVTL